MSTDQGTSRVETSPVEESTLSLVEVASPVWTNRRRILLFSLIVAGITLGVNFLLPVYYKSTVRILPETGKNRLSAFNQFADVAQLAGVSGPGNDISRLYPVIISSETVLRTVLETPFQSIRHSSPVRLVEYFEFDDDTHEENMERGVGKLRDLLTAGYESRTGVVTVSLELPEAQLAANVLNHLVGELDSFMRLKRVSSASEQRKWIEMRLEQVSGELRTSEESLREFREKNRRVIDSPQLLLEQERRVRDVQVKSTVYVELVKQSELAKIEEIKNIAIVNVMDPGTPAVRKERPKRLLNTLLAFALSLVIVSAFYVSRSVYGEQWNLLKNSLGRSTRR